MWGPDELFYADLFASLTASGTARQGVRIVGHTVTAPNQHDLLLEASPGYGFRRDFVAMPEGVALLPNAIRIHQAGGPEVLAWEPVEVGAPGPGEARLNQRAVRGTRGSPVREVRRVRRGRALVRVEPMEPTDWPAATFTSRNFTP